jgi:hypothetical protein
MRKILAVAAAVASLLAGLSLPAGGIARPAQRRLRLAPQQLQQLPKFRCGRPGRQALDAPIMSDGPLARDRKACPTTALATDCGSDYRLFETAIHGRDEQPCAAVRHGKFSRSSSDGSGPRDRFEQIDLAGTDGDVGAAGDAQAELNSRRWPHCYRRCPTRRLPTSRDCAACRHRCREGQRCDTQAAARESYARSAIAAPRARAGGGRAPCHRTGSGCRRRR